MTVNSILILAQPAFGGELLNLQQIFQDEKFPFQGLQSDYETINPTFSTGGHSAAMVPILAYGPGAEKYSGIYENTGIDKRVLELTP